MNLKVTLHLIVLTITIIGVLLLGYDLNRVSESLRTTKDRWSYSIIEPSSMDWLNNNKEE